MVTKSSKFAKGSQRKHKPKTDLEGHIIIDGTSEINALDIALQAIDGDHIVPFPSSDLLMKQVVLADFNFARTSCPHTARHTCESTIPKPISRVKLVENALTRTPVPKPSIAPRLICLTAAGFRDFPSLVKGVLASRECV